MSPRCKRCGNDTGACTCESPCAGPTWSGPCWICGVPIEVPYGDDFVCYNCAQVDHLAESCP